MQSVAGIWRIGRLWIAVNDGLTMFLLFVTFRVRRSRGEMYIGHGRLCVCLSVAGRIPTLLHGPRCNLGNAL